MKRHGLATGKRIRGDQSSGLALKNIWNRKLIFVLSKGCFIKLRHMVSRYDLHEK